MKIIINKVLLILLFIPAICFSQEKIDLLILNKQYDEALQQIEELLQKEHRANLFLEKGLIYNQLNQYQDATVAFSTALELEPQNPEILGELADALSILGNYQDAVPYYKRAAKIQPGNLQMAGKLGRSYIKLKKYNKAYPVFSGIFQQDSTNVYWNKQFAFCAYHTGKKEEAIKLNNKVLEQNPRDYTSWFNLIKLYQQTEKLNLALKTIVKGLQHFPGDDGLFLQQAIQYFAGKQYEEARTAYENYFSAGGDSTYKAMMNYGITLYFSKDENKAISILEKCAGLVANDPYVLFYLSLSHKKLVHYEVAEAYMKAAIESATPSYLPEMYHHLGQIFGQQRKFEKSIAALKEANKLNPTNHEVLFEIATTYEEFNSNKTLALNYYRIYLNEAGEEAKNINYALDRIKRIKEELFFEE